MNRPKNGNSNEKVFVELEKLKLKKKEDLDFLRRWEVLLIEKNIAIEADFCLKYTLMSYSTGENPGYSA